MLDRTPLWPSTGTSTIATQNDRAQANSVYRDTVL